MEKQTGFADVNGAKLYYELAGEGTPFVMIHAGIADNRMWNHEFETFAESYQVLRFDMRGYGKSEPVEGDYNIQDDLVALLEHLNIKQPAIIMGCSMGGGRALDYTLTYPDRVNSLILVGSGPAGLELDAEEPHDLIEQAEQAYTANDLDLCTELEIQIWIDGRGRTKADVDPEVRQFAYDMNRIAIGHSAKNIGKHIRKEFDKLAFQRLDELNLPILIVVGENDIEYLSLAADYMENHLTNASRVTIANAGHLPNIEHPQLFQEAVEHFLKAR